MADRRRVRHGGDVPILGVLGVPILRERRGHLVQGATDNTTTGAFTTLAQNLVAQGEGNAILRLGWEFTGNWYPWSVTSPGDAANFVSFWQQIVTTMRAVPGAQFSFLWNPNGASPTSYSPDAAYPGNAYVDYVGTDVYDEYWGSPVRHRRARGPTSFNIVSRGPRGLNWRASPASTASPSHFPNGRCACAATATGSVTTRTSSTSSPTGSRGQQRGLHQHLLVQRHRRGQDNDITRRPTSRHAPWRPSGGDAQPSADHIIDRCVAPCRSSAGQGSIETDARSRAQACERPSSTRSTQAQRKRKQPGKRCRTLRGGSESDAQIGRVVESAGEQGVHGLGPTPPIC